MKKMKIFLILILICVFGVTGCEKKDTNETKINESTTTKSTGSRMIDGKLECDKNNAEFVAYVENYKKSYAYLSSDGSRRAPYAVFFYTEAEKESYLQHAFRLGYVPEGESIPYENSTCKGKLYIQILKIETYHYKRLSKVVYIPPTPKDKIIPADTYIEQNGLLHLVSE